VGCVRLAAWAASLPDGLDTRLGRNGDTASGGQRQRIALARVALAGHRVVVLDEPTAHLDRVTAREVIDDLLGASMAGRSCSSATTAMFRLLVASISSTADG
jgi:ABC-type bacteriocin/lantibiotic exporter with double-glycine peptidase domain